jgi:very-short-patch-repair endonuclease/ribosomal protein S19E (S16A)
VRRPRGYWKQWENVEKAILVLGRKLGHEETLPSENEMQKHGLGALPIAIEKFHGGRQAVAKRMGLRTKRRPYGRLRSNRVLTDELLDWVAQYGIPCVMPTMAQLKRTEPARFDLIAAIAEHGGPSVVAAQCRLQMQHSKKPDGYYDDFENVKREVRLCVAELQIPGQMPTPRELQKLGLKTLVGVIVTEYGGFESVAIAMGLRPTKKRWTEARVYEAVQLFVNTQGQAGIMPTGEELRCAGRSDIENAIRDHTPGPQTVADRLDLKYRGSKPNGFWSQPGNLDKELLALIRERGVIGQMPTQRQLCDWGRHDLAVAISRTPGNVPAVAARNGLGLNQKPKGYWDTFENLEREIIDFNQSGLSGAIAGFLPPRAVLLANGESGIMTAIRRHGGYSVVARRLGLLCDSDYRWRSRIEFYLAYELLRFFEFDPAQHKVQCEGRLEDVDILIPSLELIVEYDSHIYHRHPDRIRRDKRKTRKLQGAGWTVIRAREQTRKKNETQLAKIGEHDVLVPAEPAYKPIANAVLLGIVDACNVKPNGLDDYLNEESLLNEAAAVEAYCQTVLEEKMKRGKPKTLTPQRHSCVCSAETLTSVTR